MALRNAVKRLRKKTKYLEDVTMQFEFEEHAAGRNYKRATKLLCR